MPTRIAARFPGALFSLSLFFRSILVEVNHFHARSYISVVVSILDISLGIDRYRRDFHSGREINLERTE
jgi:hypothetical protein